MASALKWPSVWYGKRGRCYCEACAEKAGAKDKKPLSRKELARCCDRCERPLLAVEKAG